MRPARPPAVRRGPYFSPALPRIFALIPGAIILFAVLNLSVPYFALQPGPARDVIRLIDVTGVKTYPVNGELLLTTVAVSSLRTSTALRAWIDPAETVVKREVIVPEGETEQQVDVRVTEQMAESQTYAAAAALKRLGYEVKEVPAGARVTSVAPDGPAAGKLFAGDVVVGVDGAPVTEGKHLVDGVGRHEPGETVKLRVRRGTQTAEIDVKTIPRPENPKLPIVGILIEDAIDVKLPIDVKIDAAGIGGPSAGMMYALGLVELLEQADLAKGRVVAGTGVIGLDGRVGPVGGIEQKTAGARRAKATIFLVPKAEHEAACEVARGLRMVAIETLDDAVKALSDDAFARERSCR